jgi:hypothetical protein
MYCSSCGGAVTQGVTYCNHCGARLGKAKIDEVSKPIELFPDSLIWAIATVFIVGIGGIIGLMAVMKEVLKLNEGIIIAVIMLSFGLVFMVEGALIWLLLRRYGVIKEADDAERVEEHTTRELGEASALSLPEPLPSVTESTTRSFEPIYSERKSE